jgi:Ulp1 family protease
MQDDCGVFTFKFMEVFKPELDMRTIFSKDDIMHIRIQLANQLYFCTRNTADKSLVLNFSA